VFLCKHIKSGEIRVLKEIDTRSIKFGRNGNKKLAQLQRELEIHSTVAHPNIVKCIEFFENKDQTKMQIILEYCSEGDVMDYMERKSGKKLNETEAKTVVREVATALQYLHENKLLHRDIKPENILLSSTYDSTGFPVVKVSDFGISKELNGTVARTFTGSPIYMAPEITQNEDENEYSFPADMWALGVSLYVMLFGCFPDLDGTMNFVPVHKGWESLSSDAKELLRGLILPSVEDRLTVDQVLACKWLL
jgi:serine/threonine protein kinase